MPRQEVLLGKAKTGPVPRKSATAPEPVLNFVDEDEKKRTTTGRVPKQTATPPQPVLNFVDEDQKKRTATGKVNLNEAVPVTPAIPQDTSNIKIAKPVDIDSVTGLLATQVQAAPTAQAPPTPREESASNAVRIVGSSTEFKIEKDGPKASVSKPDDVDTQEKTRIEMEALLEDTKNKAVEETRRAAEVELKRVTEQARIEADRARKELEVELAKQLFAK